MTVYYAIVDKSCFCYILDNKCDQNCAIA